MANGLLGDPTALRGLLQSPSTTDFALAMLANSGYSPRRRSLGEIVGASMLQSRQMAAEQAQQKLREEYMRAQIQAMQAKQEPRPEELEIIVGEDGKPIYVPRSQAAGKSPFLQARGETSQTAALQEYEQAKSQGYTGTFMDYKRAMANMTRAPQAPVQPPETPASIREWEIFSRMNPEQQANYLRMKRASTIANIGGVPTDVTAPTPRPLSSRQAEDEAKFGAAAATAAGTAAGQAGAAQDKKAANARSVQDLLADAESLIDKSTAGALGAGADIALGGLGVSTAGREAIAELEILQAALMLNMPRMEGPQSDRDVKLYEQAAGQIANPMLPRAVRKTAVRRIIALNERYASARPQSGLPQGSFTHPSGATVTILPPAGE